MTSVTARSLSVSSALSSFSPKREQGYARLSLTDNVAKKILARIQAPNGEAATFFVFSALSVTDAFAAFTRHVLQIVPSVGPSHPVVSGLGHVSAGIGLLLGSAVTVGNGIADLNQSQKIGDDEGRARAGTQILSGAVSTNASALWIVRETAAVAFSSVSIATDVLVGVGALINLGIAVWGILIATYFRSQINSIAGAKSVTEKEKVIQTLEFLKGKLLPTEKECEAIVNEIEKLHPHWSKTEKRLEAQKKTLDLAEVKFSYVKRRTSQAATVRLLKEIDQHLLRLSNPHCKDLESAIALIREVKSQNLKQIFLTAIMATTSLLAFTALILSTIFSLGVLPYALLALSSGIVLAVLLYPMFIDHISRTKTDALESRAIAMAPITINANSPGASG